MENLTVVVHGPSGSQGAPVVAAVLARGHAVRAVARRPERAPAGTSHVPADLLDPASLRRAYEGADAVVLQLPLVFDGRAEEMAGHAAGAVADAGVARVLVSLGGPVPPQQVGVPFLDARLQLLEALEASSATTLAVGPAGPYMENLALPASLGMLARGVLAYPLPSAAPVPWLATADLAAILADAVGTPEEGRLVVVGPEALIGEHAADVLAQAVGHPVGWRTLTAAEYEAQLVGDIGPEAAAGIAGFYAAAADGPPPPPPEPTTVRRGETTLAAWAEARSWRAEEAA